MKTNITWSELSHPQREDVLASFGHEPDCGLFTYDVEGGEVVSRRLREPVAAEPAEEKEEEESAAPAPPQAAGQILRVRRAEIRPSPLNPRKNFPDEYLSELGLNMRNNGQINPLIVRRCEPDARHPEARFELIAGERRWRASAARPHPERPEEEMPEIAELQIVVLNLPDPVVLEQMVSENMKRCDLTPLEEMDAFSRMLAQVDEAGRPLYTVPELGEKIGSKESYVRERLALRKLTKAGRKALAEERIPFRTARVICRCPESIIAQVEDEVLFPKKYDRWHNGEGPLSSEDAQDLIRAKFVRELRGVPFGLNDPNLVTVQQNEAGERVAGGACTDCPWNSANQPDADAREGREPNAPRGRGRPAGEGKFCFNPACFQKKVDVHIASELVKAREQGCKILSGQEAGRVIYDNGQLHHAAPFVKLDERPDHDDRARNVEEKKCPTWEKLVTGEATPPVVIAVDGRGHVHRLVDRKLAIAAAQKNRQEKFLNLSSGRAASRQESDCKEQKKRDAEKARESGEASAALMGALVAAVEEQGVPADFWPAAKEMAMRHAGSAGVLYVCKRRGLDRKKDQYDVIKKAADAATGSALMGLLIELLLAQDWAYASSPRVADIVPAPAKPLLKLYGVDAKKIADQARAGITEKRKVAKGNAVKTAKPKTDPEPRPAATKGKKKTPKKHVPPAAQDREKMAASMKARWAAREKARAK